MKPTKRNPPHQPGPGKSVPGPRTDWGGVAEWYDGLVGESGSEYHQQVVLPGVLRLLALQPGETAIDIACGQGVLCRLLRDRGVQMTGIDAAAGLIRAARQRSETPAPSSVQNAGTANAGAANTRAENADPSHTGASHTGAAHTGAANAGAADTGMTHTGVTNPEPRDAAAPHAGPPIRYHVADARELSFLPGDHYTAAACVLSIQNMHPLPPVFGGVARLLRPGGRFVAVMMHPCFRGPKETSWGWDDAAKVQYRRVDRYLVPRKTPIVTHPGKSPDVYTWSFHKPIEAYVKALRGAGLLVDAMEEWPSHKTSDSGPRAPAENTARKEIPMFMAIRAIKVAGLQGAADDAEAGNG